MKIWDYSGTQVRIRGTAFPRHNAIDSGAQDQKTRLQSVGLFTQLLRFVDCNRGSSDFKGGVIVSGDVREERRERRTRAFERFDNCDPIDIDAKLIS